MSQSTALVARLSKPAAAGDISVENWQLLTDVIFPGATDPLVIVTAWNYCKARRLDPMKRPIHIVPMYSRTLRRKVESIWPGIGELETTAARSGAWAGMDAPEWGPMIRETFEGSFDNNDGTTRNASMTIEYPEWCQVTVWRLVNGQRASFAEPVFWKEAYARTGFRSEVPNEMWGKRPRGQLQKCAKAASLRAAFPEDIGNDYTSDEMEGQVTDMGGPIIEGRVEPEEPSRPRQQQRQASNGQAGNGQAGNGQASNGQASNGQASNGQASNGQASNGAAAPAKRQGDYSIKMGAGVGTYETGQAFVQNWQDGIAYFEKAGKLDQLRELRTANAPDLDRIAGFDPAAVATVRAMLKAALDPMPKPATDEREPAWMTDPTEPPPSRPAPTDAPTDTPTDDPFPGDSGSEQEVNT